jgi:hypothetical protein
MAKSKPSQGVLMPPSTSLSPPAGRRLNALLAWMCLALALLLPALTLYTLATTPAEAWLADLGLEPLATAHPPAWHIATWQSGLALLAGMLPVCGVAYGLLHARLCFRGFVAGRCWDLGTVRHLRALASGMLFSALAGLLCPTLTSLLLTLGAPAGQHTLRVHIGSSELLLLLFAGIVWQIAQVLAQAVALADEHALIV